MGQGYEGRSDVARIETPRDRVESNPTEETNESCGECIQGECVYEGEGKNN